MRRSARRADGCALVIFDFDDFRAINDTRGQPVGDAVLRAVADACAAVVREGDCLARIGGDEFALVRPGPAARGCAGRRGADRAVEHALLPEGIQQVDASFAYTLAPEDGSDPVTLFACADAAPAASSARSPRAVYESHSMSNAMRSFDPRHVGRLECTAWVTYYRREWLKFLWAAFALTRHTFALSWPATLYGGWLVLRANQLSRRHAVAAAATSQQAAQQRALAMRHSDRWVEEGCHRDSPLVPEERAALVRSYAALLAAVHRP